MGNWSELKRQHHMLHRFMCGLTVSCIMVTVIGGSMAGQSSFDVTVWALVVAIGLLVVEQVIIRFWASWEFVHTASKRKPVRRR